MKSSCIESYKNFLPSKYRNTSFSAVLILILSVPLSGCEGGGNFTLTSGGDNEGTTSGSDSEGTPQGEGGENAASTVPVSPFNFLTVSASNSPSPNADVAALTMSWSSAGSSDDGDITYTVCQKNTDLDNDCESLGTVTNSLSLEVVATGAIANAASDFFILATRGNSTTFSNERSLTNDISNDMVGYFKASNPDDSDFFAEVTISNDGAVFAVGADAEDSSAQGIDGDGTDNSASGSGAVYVFRLENGIWSEEAYIKSSNSDANDAFGEALAISGDGLTLVVSAPGESSNATGINGLQSDNSLNESGAVYVFRYQSNQWVQQAYLKAAVSGADDRFGAKVAVSDNGNLLVVTARGEDSNATTIDGDANDNSAAGSGAAYVFRFDGTNWSQEAYLKASNTDAGDEFGHSVALSADGTAIAVGARYEASSSTGVNGTEADNSLTGSGAVYLYRYSGSSWSQEAYIKSSNNESFDLFGASVALNEDGTTLAVGAENEDSNATGIDGDQSDNSESGAGAVFVFNYGGSSWAQTSYIKASNTEGGDNFGYVVSLSLDGNSLAVTAYSEDSGATGIDGNQSDNSTVTAGAVYLFDYSGSVWSQRHYLKPLAIDNVDLFGVGMVLSGDGLHLLSATRLDDSAASGINGDDTDNSLSGSGAVYLY